MGEHQVNAILTSISETSTKEFSLFSAQVTDNINWLAEFRENFAAVAASDDVVLAVKTPSDKRRQATLRAKAAERGKVFLSPAENKENLENDSPFRVAKAIEEAPAEEEEEEDTNKKGRRKGGKNAKAAEPAKAPRPRKGKKAEPEPEPVAETEPVAEVPPAPVTEVKEAVPVVVAASEDSDVAAEEPTGKKKAKGRAPAKGKKGKAAPKESLTGESKDTSVEVVIPPAATPDVSAIESVSVSVEADADAGKKRGGRKRKAAEEAEPQEEPKRGKRAGRKGKEDKEDKEAEEPKDAKEDKDEKDNTVIEEPAEARKGRKAKAVREENVDETPAPVVAAPSADVFSFEEPAPEVEPRRSSGTKRKHEDAATTGEAVEEEPPKKKGRKGAKEEKKKPAPKKGRGKKGKKEPTPPPANREFCEKCDNGGDLVMCDGCPATWHLACLDPPCASIPEGDWFCPPCVKKRNAADTTTSTQPSMLSDVSLATENLSVSDEPSFVARSSNAASTSLSSIVVEPAPPLTESNSLDESAVVARPDTPPKKVPRGKKGGAGRKGKKPDEIVPMADPSVSPPGGDAKSRTAQSKSSKSSKKHREKMTKAMEEDATGSIARELDARLLQSSLIVDGAEPAVIDGGSPVKGKSQVPAAEETPAEVSEPVVEKGAKPGKKQRKLRPREPSLGSQPVPAAVQPARPATAAPVVPSPAARNADSAPTTPVTRPESAPAVPALHEVHVPSPVVNPTAVMSPPPEPVRAPVPAPKRPQTPPSIAPAVPAVSPVKAAPATAPARVAEPAARASPSTTAAHASPAATAPPPTMTSVISAAAAQLRETAATTIQPRMEQRLEPKIAAPTQALLRDRQAEQPVKNYTDKSISGISGISTITMDDFSSNNDDTVSDGNLSIVQKMRAKFEASKESGPKGPPRSGTQTAPRPGTVARMPSSGSMPLASLPVPPARTSEMSEYASELNNTSFASAHDTSSTSPASPIADATPSASAFSSSAVPARLAAVASPQRPPRELPPPPANASPVARSPAPTQTFTGTATPPAGPCVPTPPPPPATFATPEPAVSRPLPSIPQRPPTQASRDVRPPSLVSSLEDDAEDSLNDTKDPKRNGPAVKALKQAEKARLEALKKEEERKKKTEAKRVQAAALAKVEEERLQAEAERKKKAKEERAKQEAEAAEKRRQLDEESKKNRLEMTNRVQARLHGMRQKNDEQRQKNDEQRKNQKPLKPVAEGPETAPAAPTPAPVKPAETPRVTSPSIVPVAPVLVDVAAKERKAKEEAERAARIEAEKQKLQQRLADFTQTKQQSQTGVPTPPATAAAAERATPLSNSKGVPVPVPPPRAAAPAAGAPSRLPAPTHAAPAPAPPPTVHAPTVVHTHPAPAPAPVSTVAHTSSAAPSSHRAVPAIPADARPPVSAAVARVAAEAVPAMPARTASPDWRSAAPSHRLPPEVPRAPHSPRPVMGPPATPPRVAASAVPHKTSGTEYKDYDITNMKEDDSSDDEDRPKKSIPEWARPEHLQRALDTQQVYNPDEIFDTGFLAGGCNLAEVFRAPSTAKKNKYARRGSSGDWQEDRLTHREEKLYKVAMGFG